MAEIKRFWYPAHMEPDLRDSGFLADPEGEYGSIFAKDAKSLDALRSEKLLILLGEPGIGKSDAIEKALRNATGRIVCVKLGLSTTRDDLRLAIDRGPEVQEWRKDDSHLELFLDGFDECEVPHLFEVLPTILTNLPQDRLFVRITCRTAVYPSELGTEIARVLGLSLKDIPIYKLAPLRRRDVAQFAEEKGVQFDAFLQAVFEQDVISFASVPITLLLLLSSFKDGQSLGRDRDEIYYKGLLRLCEEHNPRRRSRSPNKLPNPKKRLLTAIRIAGLSVLCRRPVIWLGNLTDAKTNELSVGDILEDTESDLSPRDAEDVFETALFSPLGSERLTWAHKTYSEWLAARFLLQATIPMSQLRSLLVESSTNKVYPQLYEVAAWVANGNAHLMDWLIENNPAVLLRSELAKLNNAQKARLVTSLVGEMRRGSLEEPWGARHIYAKLAYPSAANDLRPIIADVQEDQFVRRLAINLAEDMRLQGVVDDVLAITLSPSEPIRLRMQSLWYLKNIGSLETRRKLRPLIHLRGKENRSLKEEALLALWPESLSTRRMLRFYSLGYDRTERQSSWHASYQIAEHLTDDDVEIGLRQLLARRLRRGENSELGRVGKTLCEKAWKNIHREGIARLLSRIVARRLRLHRPAFDWDTLEGFTQQAFRSDTERRRMLIEGVVQTAKSSRKEFFELSRLLDKSDFKWLLTKAIAGNDSIWAWAARSQTDLASDEDLALAFDAAQASSAVSEAFHFMFQSPMRSRTSQWRREDLEWQQKAESERIKRDARIVQLRSALKNLFDESSTNPDAFWRVVAHLSLDNEEQFAFSSDVEALPGWQCLDDDQRTKWLAICEHYLLNADPKSGKRALFSATWPDRAGYLAFISLLRETPDFTTLALLETKSFNRAPRVESYVIASDSRILTTSIVWRRRSSPLPKDAVTARSRPTLDSPYPSSVSSTALRARDKTAWAF